MTCAYGPVYRVAWVWCLHVPLIGAVVAAVLRSSAAVAEQGFVAIGNLSARNAANQTRLREAGACEGVWIVLSWFVRVYVCSFPQG